MSLKKVFH